MKNFYNFSLNKSWVFHFTLAVIHDFALYCLIIPIKNGIINASKNFMCAWVCVRVGFASFLDAGLNCAVRTLVRRHFGYKAAKSSLH